MDIEKRKSLIRTLETELSTRVLSVVTGDRQGMDTRVAPDILPLVSEHLYRIGASEEIALFLYTPGGDSNAGWGLVNLVRQYCKRLRVLVPFRALSCGTLIALGADEILMGTHGLLSPIDPSVASPFNPEAPGGGQPGRVNLLPVSVEDMMGFLALARSEEVGLKSEEAMAEALRMLAGKVHPLALGAVYRAREQSNSLAKRLLSKHLTDKERVDRIVSRLTRELPTHNYLIGRQEALDIELHVKEPPSAVEDAMWKLYKEYEAWLLFTSPASPEQDMGTDPRMRVRYERAVIESLDGETMLQHIFITDKELVRFQAPLPGTQIPVEQIAERVVYQGWRTAADGEVQ